MPSKQRSSLTASRVIVCAELPRISRPLATMVLTVRKKSVLPVEAALR